MGIFETYTSDLIEKVDITYNSVEPVDAIEFVTSSDFLNEDPTPFQSVALKTVFGLWPYYPPSDKEQNLLNVLKNKWKLNIDLDRTDELDPVTHFILVLGRRSTKSTTASFFATYSMYTLICRGNPQEYYGIRERHPIYITHVAAKGKQAEAVFTLTRDNIRKVPFFRPYIDFEKDNSTELRLFSPYDLLINTQIKLRNQTRQRGILKESLLPGSLNIKSITTSAATNRGDATFMLMLSEFAHFQRAKIEPGKSLEQVSEENPQTDYAIYKALAPAVKDFGKDGKIILESSPREKGGEFYRHYCIGGGSQQEPIKGQDGAIIPFDIEKGYQVIQLATWEARPTISREDLSGEFRTDPKGAEMEYGANFGNPSGTFISEETIKKIPIPGRYMLRRNPNIMKFCITVDPGGKAKAKEADAYAIAWGHYELNRNNDFETTYWVDGMQGFLADTRDLGGGLYESVEVDPNKALSFILQLVKDLGGKQYIMEIAYDQWQNQSAVSTLQHLGIPAIETTFTNPYKAEMYGDFLAKALLGQVKMYGVDEGGWINRWELEMKYLQQVISGNKVFYHHPTTGPVRHDDFSDACFLKDTKIVTKQGLKNIQEISIGEEVLTHKGRFRKVLQTSKRFYKGKIIGIKAYGLPFKVKCTFNHLWYAHKYQECGYKVKEKGICTPSCNKRGEKSCKESYKDLDWRRATELKIHQQLYYPIYNKINIKEGDKIDLLKYINNSTLSKCFIEGDTIYYGLLWNKKQKNSKSRGVPRFITCTKELFRYLGFYVAEGSSSNGEKKTNQICFSFNANEKSYIDEVIKYTKEIFGLNTGLTKKETSTQVYFYSQFLSNFFKLNFGIGAENKKIPLFVKEADENLLQAFISGYFHGDGCDARTSNFTACGSISEQLIWDVRDILLKIGIASGYSKRLNDKDSYYKDKIFRGTNSVYHMLNIQGEFKDVYNKFMDYSKEERELHKFIWLDSEALHNRIRKIDSNEFEGNVYNLEVEEDHSYVTQIGAVHNCANLVHRLSRLAYPKKEDIRKNRMHKDRQMLVSPRTIKPVAGPRLWGGNPYNRR